MIASLSGVLVAKSPASLIVDVHGVGYQVWVPLCTFYRLPDEKAAVTLHIHTHVREDALQLYGFLTMPEKDLFLMVTGISGIGPKLALNILSGMEMNELTAAIRAGQVERLQAIPGVGPKTAGRLVLELREKIAPLAAGAPPAAQDAEPHQTGEEALSALVNLGYSRLAAKKVLDPILEASPRDIALSALIREALKQLARA